MGSISNIVLSDLFLLETGLENSGILVKKRTKREQKENKLQKTKRTEI